MTEESTRLILRKGTKANVEVLDVAQIAYYTDKRVIVAGNGTSSPDEAVMTKATQLVTNKVYGEAVFRSTGTNANYVLPMNEHDIITMTRGVSITFEAHVTNAGPATLQVGGSPAADIVLFGADSLPPSVIVKDSFVTVMFDGGNYRLTSVSSSSGGGGASLVIGATNIGNGTGIYKVLDEDGILQLKTIKGDNGVTISYDAQTVTISGSGTGGGGSDPGGSTGTPPTFITNKVDSSFFSKLNNNMPTSVYSVTANTKAVLYSVKVCNTSTEVNRFTPVFYDSSQGTGYSLGQNMLLLPGETKEIIMNPLVMESLDSIRITPSSVTGDLHVTVVVDANVTNPALFIIGYGITTINSLITLSTAGAGGCYYDSVIFSAKVDGALVSLGVRDTDGATVYKMAEKVKLRTGYGVQFLPQPLVLKKGQSLVASCDTAGGCEIVLCGYNLPEPE